VAGLFDLFPDPCGDFGGAEPDSSLDVKTASRIGSPAQWENWEVGFRVKKADYGQPKLMFHTTLIQNLKNACGNAC
jgi:hypothetical protein